jgi:F-type H+-transporting ATPase subunit b
MDSIISTFHIDWKIIVAQMINFGIVLAVLYIYALKPLNKLMKERGDKIAKGVDDAKSNAATLVSTRAEYDSVIAKARAEASNIFQEGKKDAEMKKSQMMESAQLEVAGMIDQGKKMLEVQKIKMVEEARKEIVSLALMAAEKLIDARADETLTEKSIKQFDNL